MRGSSTAWGPIDVESVITMRVLLGVSGGIAAYKAAAVVRRLRERGHEVRCATTAAAESFVSPLTLEVLSGSPVYNDSYLEANGSGEELHITAAKWADAYCIAPATANTIARLALGLAEDFVSTVALAFEGPLYVAPAMHSAMWKKSIVQANVRRLAKRDVHLLGPVRGRLASGEEGWGRMLEPEEIVDAIVGAPGDPLEGRAVVVTAGPTFEPVDPVRFLGNRSSGKMGFALAFEAARRGARVILIAGPVSLETPPGVERVDVHNAREMEAVVHRKAANADLIIMAAAVSDYRPAEAASQKIKKSSGLREIELVENPDILRGLESVAPDAVRVGFAAETDDLEAQAAAKLKTKAVDFLVANDVSRSDIGFESDDNEVLVYRSEGPPIHLSRKSKTAIASELLDLFGQSAKLTRSVE